MNACAARTIGLGKAVLLFPKAARSRGPPRLHDNKSPSEVTRHNCRKLPEGTFRLRAHTESCELPRRSCHNDRLFRQLPFTAQP
jgi:hypothetical protein